MVDVFLTLKSADLYHNALEVKLGAVMEAAGEILRMINVQVRLFHQKLMDFVCLMDKHTII